jgi:hypothetical protein
MTGPVIQATNGLFIYSAKTCLRGKTPPRLVKLEVDTAAVFFAGVKNCTDSVHKFLRAFLLCYESVQFLTPAKQIAAVSPYSSGLKGHRRTLPLWNRPTMSFLKW